MPYTAADRDADADLLAAMARALPLSRNTEHLINACYEILIEFIDDTDRQKLLARWPRGRRRWAKAVHPVPRVVPLRERSAS